jgi:radical SAM protein with 4Fe4S-binding SPASM domain
METRPHPELPRPFTLRVEPLATLLYSRRTRAYTRRTASEAFLCTAASELGVAEAVAMLEAQVGAEAAREAAESLELAGVLNGDHAAPVHVVEHGTAPTDAYAAPLVAHLGVTLACNYACNHCYSSSGKRAPDELELTEIKALVDALADAGCMKLVLGGGEPFIRKDLGAIIRHAHARGVDTFVHTNAALLKPGMLRDLADVPPSALAVSLDGADPATNDAIRGDGTFVKTLKGMSVLRAHHAPGFNLSVTITPKNAHHAAAMVDLAAAQGAGVLLLRPAYPAGEAAAHGDALWCDRATFATAVDAARARAAERGVTLDAPHPAEQGVPDYDGFGCVAGKVVMGIDPRGRVTPCLNLPDDYLAGSVRDAPVLQLWQGGASFARVRDTQPNAQCSTCLHQDTCRGGCRVRALHVGNGADGPDAWCHYEPRPGVDAVPFVKPGARLRVLRG